MSVWYGEVAFFASLPPLLPPFTLPLLWGGVGEGEPRVLELRFPLPERLFQQLCREPQSGLGLGSNPSGFMLLNAGIWQSVIQALNSLGANKYSPPSPPSILFFFFSVLINQNVWCTREFTSVVLFPVSVLPFPAHSTLFSQIFSRL